MKLLSIDERMDQLSLVPIRYRVYGPTDRRSVKTHDEEHSITSGAFEFFLSYYAHKATHIQMPTESGSDVTRHEAARIASQKRLQEARAAAEKQRKYNSGATRQSGMAMANASPIKSESTPLYLPTPYITRWITYVERLFIMHKWVQVGSEDTEVAGWYRYHKLITCLHALPNLGVLPTYPPWELYLLNSMIKAALVVNQQTLG
ncbi:uncharacterized protein LACBIDRAFT_323213 [Laccaria bicolor S238N-H82]|uniref:Predicted protein n=1 Tax=Laccaria bicolor (strain S238N-H82 / ATCC MYA-4686) TaxID=486041 RepID=B0CZH0_LACBS|nr:uncharacterized protein LACBIDRAFT_323213 [Laccaria bicolor S238N-H82]EDR12145.1 predicted protein [Laccaria bicolor S238N-H82]|eukprot:XP_001876409.1 predicted protein [Laccaria bicolor S238N-H82]